MLVSPLTSLSKSLDCCSSFEQKGFTPVQAMNLNIRVKTQRDVWCVFVLCLSDDLLVFKADGNMKRLKSRPEALTTDQSKTLFELLNVVTHLTLFILIWSLLRSRFRTASTGL